MPATRKLAAVLDLAPIGLFAPTVMVIDGSSSEPLIPPGLTKQLGEGIRVLSYATPHDAIEHARHTPVDLVLTAYSMPGLNGVATVRQLREMYPYEALPIIMVAAADERAVLRDAFDAGVSDFMLQPVDPVECRARCNNLLGWRQHYLNNCSRERLLEQRVEQVSRDLRLREVDTLLRLAGAADRRDAVTGSHLKRMAKYSALIARGIGLSEDQVEAIELAAPMHDIGKIAIPDAIVRKSEPLNAEEVVVMRTHARIGYEILKDSPSRFLQAAAVIALHHHEKFDGTGYPQGLRGKDIPLKARIVALADVFDALTSERSYKTAWAWQQAVDYIVEHKGTHFDPDLVDVFLGRLDEAHTIQQALGDPDRSD